MLGAPRETVQRPASVFQSTSEIHMLLADQSVQQTRNVRRTKLVRTENALILALVFVESMLSAVF